MARLKVFSGTIHYRVASKQLSAIVATTSQKEAARIARTSVHDIRRFWSVTANEAAVAAATAQPGKLLVRRLDDYQGAYVPLEEFGQQASSSGRVDND